MSKRNRYQKRDTATLERSKRSGLALASMASYDGAMPDKTRMMSNRIGTNPNSAYAQQQRVTLMWQAEDLVKNSDWVSVCYSLKQYCQPIGYLAQTGDPALDSEVNQYMREVMKRGGINQSALSAFSCAAHVEMPVRGDSILERYDDETQLRFIVRCADQIGELYRFVNPASYGAEAFVQPPAPSVRYIAGIFLAPNGMNEAFKIYERGYNQTYLNPQIVPACNVIYFQDNLFDGHRGVSKFAPAIQSIQKRNKIWQSGMDSMAIQSKIAAIASNASGSPDPLDYETTTNSDGTITYTEKMADGAVVKYQFSDGDSYQFMKSEAPGPALLQGLDYSDERTCLSLGFPKAFLISARDGGGAPTRFDMSRAGREIMRLRNDVYLPRLEKMAYLFLMDGIARKKLPARAGVLNGNWHWPSLPTADAFRDDKSDVEAMRAGLTTRTAIIAKNGDGTFEDVLARGTQEAIAIEMATQDANRELVRRGYQPSVADLNIAQDTANPTQQPEPAPEANKPQGEAPANATAALAFDEGKHPRADDGKFGSGGGGGGKAEEMGAGADGKPKKVSEMSKGELKTHGMRKKLEALRAKNAEGAKKLADTNARVSELHSQLVEQLKAGTGTANDDLKKTVSELGAKIAETKMHTQTIQHALRGEDIAADEHGQDSPEHEAARKRTEYVAKLADFDEGKHPRADDGKFGSGGGVAKKDATEPAKSGQKSEHPAKTGLRPKQTPQEREAEKQRDDEARKQGMEVAYHGGGGKDEKDWKAGANRGQLGIAYFTPDKRTAWKYALGGGIEDSSLPEYRRKQLAQAPERKPNVTKVYLDFKNPLDLTNWKERPSLSGIVETLGVDRITTFLENESSSLSERIKQQYHDENDDEDKSYEEWFEENASELESHFDDWHTEYDSESLKNFPLVRFLTATDGTNGSQLLQEYMKAKGKDGIIYDDAETGTITMVATDADQIKSAK
jgi:hypothetical protein